MRNYGLVLAGVWAALGACGGSGKSTEVQGELTVDGSPKGEITGQRRVVLTFSRPMVARDRIDQPVAAPPIAIAPEIPGEARWVDEKTLALVATGSLPVSTRYVVTVPGATKALDGASLGKAHTFEFFTERLTGTVAVVGSKERATREPVVRVTFNQEVPFEQIAQHCGFASRTEQQKVKLAPESKPGPAKDYTIAPAAPLAADTDWTVACKTSLRGSVGNVGLAENAEDKLHTYGPLRFVKLEPSGNDIVPDENLRLEIAFSNPLAAPYQMKLSPPAPGFPGQCHSLGDTPAGLSCAAQLDPLTSYTLTIDASQKDAFGQTLGKPQVLTFRTADAKPTISMESGYFIAELKRPVIPVWTRNVTSIELTTVPITQANFHVLRPVLDWWNNEPVDFAKLKITPQKKKIAITGTKNKWGQHSLGAPELVGGTPGPGMFYVEVGSKEVERPPFEGGGRQKVLVNFTDIGVVSKLSDTRGLVWATRLSTGKPLPGATVTVRDGRGAQTWTGTTDADGVAVLPPRAKLYPAAARSADPEAAQEFGGGDDELRIYVQHQTDWTMINPTRSAGLSAWNYNVDVDYEHAPARLRGFMHTDRGLYRPGDKVHVKGLARVTRLGEPLAVAGEGKKVKVDVEGPQGKTFTQAEARLSPFGGFWFDVDLPGDARLGDYTIRARLEHGTFTRTFTVEEYRAATFEVTGKTKQAQVVSRGTVDASISANYLYGAPLRSGAVNVTVHSRPRRVAFQQHEGFQFTDERRYERYSYYDEGSQSLVAEDEVALDAKGNASASIAVTPNDVPGDADLLIRASVRAPSNEVIAKTFTVPYYRARKYFGIKSPGWFLEVKKPQKFQVIGVAPDGKPISGAAKLTVTRRDWNCVWEDWGYRGSYQCKDTKQTILAKTLQLGAGAPAEFEFTPAGGGDYLVVVEGENDKDDAAPAAVQTWAWGDGGGSWMSTDSLSFDIVADKKEYKVGDTATLLLKTDLTDATGLVTIERDGVIERRLIAITPTTKHVTVPITANHAPNVYVSVALVQGRMGEGVRGKPRMRMGLVNLPVRPEDNRLTVTVETDKADYRPGAPVTATVKVVDSRGQPVSAEVAITAADEGVLSLIAYQTPDPVPTFYAPWGLGVSSATQIEYLRDIPGPNLERPATGGDAAGTLRSRFAATAVWKPGAVTNAAGVATVQFEAPDNLTAFRVMAVAADKGYRFGSADKRFTVSKPLQLHAALPRFLNLGDQLQGGVIVHNETGKAGSATVKLVTDARLSSAGGLERTVQLPKGGRVPVLFDLTAAELGESVLTFSVAMGGERDAVQLKLPVRHPSPVSVQHVAHGVAKDAAAVPVALPADAIPASAEVVVSVDPDGLAGIEDGLRDLVGYPYGCLEQTTSKVIPMLAVRDLAESLSIDGLAGDKLEGFVKAGIAKIGRHQTAYGGFSLWPGGDPEAYYTAYALWGLYLAKQAGYAVDQTRIAEGLAYLKEDGRKPNTDKPYYSEAGNLGSQAFALYIRAMLGDKDTQAATTLAGNAKLPIYGKAFLARALAAGLGAKDPAVVKLVGELVALASAATKADKLIEEPNEDDLDGYMSSPLRTNAVVLGTLVDLDPGNAAVKPLVRAVMKQRRTSRYIDTQSNLYSLLALTSYARAAAAQSPSVTVQLGDKELFSGALAGKQRVRVVTAPVPSSGEIKIAPSGEVHYNVELRYRRKVDALKAQPHASLGLGLEYLDEAGKPKTSFQVGDVVQVRLTVTPKDNVSHLIVSSALPAGFEPLNARFATVGPVGDRQSRMWGTYRELRDDRVDFATEYSWRTNHVYEFMMRATAVGKFTQPPTVAELMYDPEVTSQTAAGVIEIKAR
ncbi:MAG TPA: MG2 domain-containing protein [Kofleriaceae bacterium]|nr:MG2 domain-containing protein [Kofleriaceae bacterium]